MPPTKKAVVQTVSKIVHSKQWNVWATTIEQHNAEIEKLGGKPVKFSSLDSEKDLKEKLGKVNETLAKLRSA